MMIDEIQKQCLELRGAYEEGLLGNQVMPEDTHPDFLNNESRLSYFTLPMSLNYQRNSYALWEAAKLAYEDMQTHAVFQVQNVTGMDADELRSLLTMYKVALQPNKHVDTWRRISTTITDEWGSIEGMLNELDYDFQKLQEAVQITHKKGFPYLSGPKIFHYWSYILGEYCDVVLKNREYIQIAPDTHVIKCSILLGILTEDEATLMPRDEISERWRDVLDGTGMSPIDMHSPLWFWSKNNFSYQLQK
ncbi:hypothetical protein I8H83_02430 [Candidatus Saccharibacteria bacterium]|nr:hypothetical protein [Candidatus Saccharibacteria bacterium]